MLRSDYKIGQKMDLNPIFVRKNIMHYNSFETHYNEL